MLFWNAIFFIDCFDRTLGLARAATGAFVACTQEAVKAIAKLEDFKPSKSEREKLIELNTMKTVCIDNLVATKDNQ